MPILFNFCYQFSLGWNYIIKRRLMILRKFDHFWCCWQINVICNVLQGEKGTFRYSHVKTLTFDVNDLSSHVFSCGTSHVFFLFFFCKFDEVFFLFWKKMNVTFHRKKKLLKTLTSKFRYRMYLNFDVNVLRCFFFLYIVTNFYCKLF